MLPCNWFANETIYVLMQHNIVPSGRISQRKDKDSIEKARLIARHSGFVRYDPEIIAEPFKVVEDSTSFMKDSERFHTDTAGESKREREEKLLQKKRIEEIKRANAMTAEEERWKREIEKTEMEEKRWEALRSNPENTKAKANAER